MMQAMATSQNNNNSSGSHSHIHGKNTSGDNNTRGPKSSSMPPMPADAAGHASRLWKFLDEMANNDPEGYATFLEQQAKNAGPELFFIRHIYWRRILCGTLLCVNK